MIKLEVQDYCHGECRDFEPEVIQSPKGSIMDRTYDPKNTIVGCKNRYMCDRIYLMVRKQLKEESK